MKYWVIVNHYGSSSHKVEFDTKQEALDFAADQTGDDSWCEIFEGKEIKFKVVRTGVEVDE